MGVPDALDRQPAEQLSGRDRPVSGSPAFEEKLGQQRSVLLARLPLTAPAGRECLARRLALPQRGERLPSLGATLRAESIVGASRLAHEPLVLFAAERTVGVPRWAGMRLSVHALWHDSDQSTSSRRVRPRNDSSSCTALNGTDSRGGPGSELRAQAVTEETGAISVRLRASGVFVEPGRGVA
jgi:hypothetical protein